MEEKELDYWYSSLMVKNKEHIAAKVLLKDGGNVRNAVYPNCTRIWNGLEPSVKEWIHAHCTDKHGMWALEENDETSLGHDF